MDFNALYSLRENHAGWLLLRARKATAAFSMLQLPVAQVFVTENLAPLLEHWDVLGSKWQPSRAALTRLTGEDSASHKALDNGSFGPAVRLEQELIRCNWAQQRLDETLKAHTWHKGGPRYWASGSALPFTWLGF